MNSSLIRADRTTHLKILVVSLVASIFVVCVGLNARSRMIDRFSASPGFERNTSKPASPQPTFGRPDELTIVSATIMT